MVLDETYTADADKLAEAHNTALRVAQNVVENTNNLGDQEAAEAYMALEDTVNNVLGTEGTPVPPQQKHVYSVFRALDQGETLSDALEGIPMNNTDRKDPEKYVAPRLERNQEFSYSNTPVNFTTTGVPQGLPDLEESDNDPLSYLDLDEPSYSSIDVDEKFL